jgi:DNA topoisomerase-1
MSKSLVIVESPAKARTISRYLGPEFEVKASVGHIKDLPKKKLGVDVRKDFKAEYQVIPGKEKVVLDLRKAAAKAGAIYLAADPDREGEAICQHIYEEVAPNNPNVHRVMFYEITKDAVRKAFETPGRIDRNLVQSQHTRRILDRLVGYKISPLLWRKVRAGLSAGRVQTVALRLIVDREREIRAFVKEEYWVFSAHLEGARPPKFKAKAVKLDGKKFLVTNATDADALRKELEGAPFVVESVKQSARRQQPAPPFTTSKLQQEANRRFKLPAAKTMQIAQRLYEGVELGAEGSVGLITYMRTDSTRTAPSAVEAVRGLIQEKYGADYLPAKPRYFSKSEQAQDAHEAIRPTAAERTPESLKGVLKGDELKLYTLIWQRFVASQMEAALFDHTDVKIAAGRCQFQSIGDVMKFAGFLKVYQEAAEEANGGEKEDAAVKLPPLEAGQALKLLQLDTEQQFTQPPPRYSEATLIKALEEKGIGRPSTYAAIVTVIQNRQYVVKDEGRFQPTETGEIVVDLLVASFPTLFDYAYTANMEKDLDRIESGQQDWLEELRGFYRGFSDSLQRAESEMKNLRREVVLTDYDCPQCGAKMVERWGRFGKFLSCQRYPECKGSMPIPGADAKNGANGTADAKQPPKTLDEACPQCGKPLVERQGRFGRFIACSGYPACRYTKQPTLDVPCPQEGCDGQIVARRSKKGKAFYGCNRYPKCQFTAWHKPVAEKCPACGNAYMLEKTTKRDGTFKECPNPECKHKVKTEETGE